MDKAKLRLLAEAMNDVQQELMNQAGGRPRPPADPPRLPDGSLRPRFSQWQGVYELEGTDGAAASDDAAGAAAYDDDAGAAAYDDAGAAAYDDAGAAPYYVDAVAHYQTQPSIPKKYRDGAAESFLDKLDLAPPMSQRLNELKLDPKLTEHSPTHSYDDMKVDSFCLQKVFGGP